jgi:hypothetical protein
MIVSGTEMKVQRETPTLNSQEVVREQGDQIVRIFAQCVIDNFGQFCNYYKMAHIFGCFLPRLRLCKLFLTKLH